MYLTVLVTANIADAPLSAQSAPPAQPAPETQSKPLASPPPAPHAAKVASPAHGSQWITFRFGGQVDIVRDERRIVSAHVALGDDDFDDSGFGLQESSFLTFGFAGDVHHRAQLPVAEDIMTMVRPVYMTALALALHTATPPAVAAQDAATIKRGAEVYAAQKCSVCHAIAGKGGKSSPLDGVGAKLSADDIRRWIVTPDEMTAKTKSTKKPPMPAKYSGLPAADLDALVAYMASLK